MKAFSLRIPSDCAPCFNPHFCSFGGSFVRLQLRQRQTCFQAISILDFEINLLAHCGLNRSSHWQLVGFVFEHEAKKHFFGSHGW